MEKVNCYHGKEPYLFISYSHRDSEKVMKIVKSLEQEGFRCWYDEGIDPGAEWDENIAQHLGECGFLVAFITDNYLKSENCKDELNYARDLNKPRLLVYLEECELPEGMAMRLNRLQAIHYYKYKNEAEALAKIFSAKQIEICKAVPESEAVDMAGEIKPEQGDLQKDKADDKSEKKAGALLKGLDKRIIIGSIAALLAVAVLIFIFTRPKDNSLDKVQTSTTVSTETSISVSVEQVTEVSAEEPEPEEEVPVYHITLSAGESMSARDYNAAKEIVKDRLAILTGNDFTYSVEGEKINIGVKKEYFAGIAVADVLRCYISRTCRLTVFDSTSFGSRYSNHIEIPNKDIEKVEIKTGGIPDLAVTKEDTEITDYDYLCITLSDNIAETIRTSVEGWTVSIGQDIGHSTFYGTNAYKFSEDYKTLCFYDKYWDMIPSLELYVYNYQNPSMESGLFYIIEPLVAWQKPEEIEEPGAFQCNADEITGDRVILSYEPLTEVRKGEWLDLQDVLRNRLDIFETPYAIGFGDTENSIAVKINTDKLSKVAAEKLLSNSTTDTDLVSGLYERYLSYDDITIEHPEDNAGKIKLTYKLWDYTYGEVTKFVNNMNIPTDGMKLSLAKHFIDADSWSLDDENKQLTLVVDSKYEKMVRLFYAISKDDAPVTCSLEGEYFDSDDGKEFTIDNTYGLNYRDKASDVLRGIKAVCPNATLVYDETQLYMHLYLNVDEDLAKTSLEAIKQIYETIDFENTPWSNLTIYIVDEIDDERCRVFFTKSYGWDTFPGSVYFSGMSMCGRVEKYKDTFEPIVEKDKFYQKFKYLGWQKEYR